jgi:hypothetical protein
MTDKLAAVFPHEGSVSQQRLSAKNARMHAQRRREPVVDGVSGRVVLLGAVDRVLGIKVDEREVGVRADGDYALGGVQAENAGGLGAQHPDEVGDRTAGFVEGTPSPCDQCLGAGRAHRDRPDVLKALLFAGVRRVVGSDHLDLPQENGGDEGIRLSDGTQRRCDLRKTTEAFEVVDIEVEVLRAGFRGDSLAARARLGDLAQGFCARDVDEVGSDARFFGDDQCASGRLCLDPARPALGKRPDGPLAFELGFEVIR